MNYKEYAKTADYTRAAVLIECAANTIPQADDDWKKRVINETKKNVGGITRVKKED